MKLLHFIRDWPVCYQTSGRNIMLLCLIGSGAACLSFGLLFSVIQCIGGAQPSDW